MADGRKVHQDDVAVALLQGNRGVHRSGGAAGAALRADEREHPRFSGTTGSPRARGTEAGQRFQQNFVARRAIHILAGTIAHAGHDIRRLRHLSIGEDGNLLGSGPNQFDGANRAMRVMHRNFYDNNFGARLLYPADDRVRWTDGEPNVAEYFIAQSSCSQALLQYGKAFPVFGQQGYSNPMHGAALADFSRCLHVRKREYPPPSDLGN